MTVTFKPIIKETMCTDKRTTIIRNLLRTIKLRLLQPGAFTELIITFYLMTAQALYCLGLVSICKKKLITLKQKIHLAHTCRSFANQFETISVPGPILPRYLVETKLDYLFIIHLYIVVLFFDNINIPYSINVNIQSERLRVDFFVSTFEQKIPL